MKRTLSFLVCVLLASTVAAQTMALPVDSTRANPFNRMKDLVGTNDVALVYDADNGLDARVLHARFRLNGEPGGQPFLQTAQFDVELGDVLSEPRRIMTAAGDVDGDGDEELIYAFSSVFGTARLRVAFVDAGTQQVTQSPFTSFGPMLTAEGYTNQESGNSEPSHFGKFEVYALDLNGDNTDEIITAYYASLTDEVRVDVWRWTGTDLVSSGVLLTDITLDLGCGPNGFNEQESWGIAFDDFDYDKRPELVIAGHAPVFPNDNFVRIYDIDPSDPTNFTFTAKGSINYGNSCNSISGVHTGDFNGDLIPEVVVTSFTGGELGAQIFRVGDNSDAAGGDYLELVQAVALGGFSTWNMTAYYDETNYAEVYDPFGWFGMPDMVMFADTKVGDFNQDGKDDVALCTPTRLQVIYGNSTMSSMGYFAGAADIYATDELVVPSPSVYDFVQMTDLDLDGYPELIYAHNAALGAEDQELRLGYFAPNAWDGADELDASVVFQASFDPYESFATSTSFSLVSGDLSGDGYTLGDPVSYNLPDIIQPIIRLGAPPVHSDDVGGEFVNITGCFAADCPFTTTYEVATETTVTVSNEVHSDWAVGASVGGGVDIGVVSVSAKVEASYGEGFSNAASTSETHTEIYEVSTSFDDYIYYSKVDYDVREYPVYQGAELKTYMVSVRPTDIEHFWRQSKNPEMELYLPLHEPGNILSYPHPDWENEVVAGLSAELIGSANYGVGAGQTYTWTVGYSDVSENSSNLSRDMSINASLNASAYGAEVGITGEYSLGSLSTHTSTVAQSITCTVDHQSFTASVADAPYSMKPYMSWGADGTLVVDYLVEPQEPSFGTENYWSLNYGIQDPAWNLPWRLDEEREFGIDDDAKRRLSKSFWMTDYHGGHQVIYPHPGDTVVVHARVFNYSLEDTEAAVPVSFYIGHPMMDGLQLTDLDGNTVVYTDSYIPAQWYKEVSFAVVLPSDEDAPDARLYGVIDPLQQWMEVHEINNYGWVALGPHFTLVDEVISVEELAGTAQDIFRVWPNPTNDAIMVQLQVNEGAELRITDLSGRVVTEQVIARGAQERIDLSVVADGMYVVTLTIGDRSWSQRVVVQ